MKTRVMKDRTWIAPYWVEWYDEEMNVWRYVYGSGRMFGLFARRLARRIATGEILPDAKRMVAEYGSEV